MPTTTTRFSHQASRRDSWPPTQMRIVNSIESEDMSMDMDKHDDNHHHSSFINDDDDPMNSFLTPTPLLDDGDTDDDEDDGDMDMDFAFDAGIENPHHPMPVVRSISPSTLASGGLPRPPATPPRAIPVPIRTPSPTHHHFLRRPGSHSPPSRNSPEVTTPMLDEEHHDDDDQDDEEEDYVRFTPRGLTIPPSPFNLGSSKSRASKMRRAKTAAVAAAKVQEKEDDKKALMIMARGYYHDGNNNNEATSSSPSLLLPPPLAPSPEFYVGRPPIARSSSSTTTSTRGRSARAFGRPPPTPLLLPSRPRSWSGASGRLSPHAWREPSPDVWSIEEEEEEEDGDDDMDVDDNTHHSHQAAVNTRKEGKKSQKKVRFAWPVREEIP